MSTNDARYTASGPIAYPNGIRREANCVPTVYQIGARTQAGKSRVAAPGAGRYKPPGDPTFTGAIRS